MRGLTGATALLAGGSTGDREAGTATIWFSDIERRMRVYLAAAFGVLPVLRAVPPGPDGPMRRVGLAGGIIRVPDAFRGVEAQAATGLYRAALAHAAAHLRFTPSRFALGSLKPLQVALVSLIEDARVEQLALAELPGLRRLWLPWHIAAPGGAVTAPGLMARLARALIDPRYADPDPWVRKGRQMFAERCLAGGDAAIGREIGSLLGNDLGQMRLQFNARTYVVEPPYRDDNMGLWNFGDSAESETEILLAVDTARSVPPEAQLPDLGGRARPVAPQQEEGVPVAQYPEWDHLIGAERPDWTTIVLHAAPRGRADAITEILRRHAPLVDRLTRLIRSARVSRPLRLRRQAEGDALDLDAGIAAAISLRGGEAPDPRVYLRTERRHRDLSTLVLLDVSQSANDLVRGSESTVLAVAREAVALLGYAMEGVGDDFSLRAFCSEGRSAVRYYPLKSFGEPFGAEPQQRLAGLTARLSTRMGAALRHAGAELAERRSHRRLLLVVTDGEPSDIDVADRRYLVEDARRAVQSLRQRAIDVFCVALDAGGDAYLTRIFGRQNVVQIDRIERLPQRLPLLYLRLTT